MDSVYDDPDILLALLEQTARKIGISVRYEPILGATEQSQSPGGLCRLGGDRLLIVDAALSTQQRCQVIAKSLRRLDLSDVFIPPLVRRFLF